MLSQRTFISEEHADGANLKLTEQTDEQILILTEQAEGASFYTYGANLNPGGAC